MTKPTILIPLSLQFSVRYIIRTGLLQALREFAEPVLVLGWDDPALRAELEADGYRVVAMPSARIGSRFERLRKKIHLLHFDHIHSPSTAIDRRRKAADYTLPFRLRTALRDALYRLEYRLPGAASAWARQEDDLLESDTNFSEFQALLTETRPDLFFSLTPYYMDEEFLARAAARTPATLVTAILSFDNITTRPRIPVLFDHYLLWNNYNRQELLRIYPLAAQKSIEVVGAPQFDFYYDPAFLWSEEVWRANLSIPFNRPVILFGGGLDSIAPAEPHIVAQLDTAISAGAFPNHPLVLLRLHPLDNLSRWNALRQTARNVIIDTAWPAGKVVAGKTNVSVEDIQKLASTLKYCAVHVNTSSTMTIDGAIFNRPQIGPAYDDRPGKPDDRIMRELYQREHFIPICASGGLQIAASYDQLITQIQEAFQSPESSQQSREKMVCAITTWADGNAAQRVVTALQRALLKTDAGANPMRIEGRTWKQY